MAKFLGTPDYLQADAVYDVATEYVSTRLTVAAVVRYPGYNESFVKKINANTFIVEGYADANKLDGPIVRIKYRLKMHYEANVKDGDNWQFNDFKLIR